MQLWELNNSLDVSLIFKPYKEAKKILEDNGFEVIRSFDAKKSFLAIVRSLKTAEKWHLFNPLTDKPDDDIMKINNALNRIVLKDTRKGSSSWETLMGYMEYRSGCFYSWFYPNGEPKI